MPLTRFENILTSHDFGYGKTGSVVAFGGVEYCYKVGDGGESLVMVMVMVVMVILMVMVMGHLRDQFFYFDNLSII